MDKKVLAPIPLWLTVLHGSTLALSLIVIAAPEARTTLMRIVLTCLFFFAFVHSLLRLKRANGFKTPMRELSKHMSTTHSFADSLAMIALTVSGLTQAFAF